MAVMWPRRVPEWVLADRRRQAEVEVYEQLARTLDDGWQVFYSRPWWGIGPRGGEQEGEADFIVAHPDRGILFVEVKGGGVEYVPESSVWISKDRNGVRHYIKDPVGQASSCKHRYLRRLRELHGWPKGFVRFRHGVVLPDSVEPGRDVLTIGGHDRRLFCFAGEYRHALDRWVAERLAAHSAPRGSDELVPGPDGVELLRRLVADPVNLHVPLQRIVRAELAEQDSLLTGQQMTAIAMLRDIPRALIVGGAGTGKTLLAIEMAIRMARAGRRVLLLCFNPPLALWLAAQIHDFDVRVATFAELCRELAEAAGSAMEFGDPGVEEELLPELALNAALRGIGPRWDAVLVDEGQDFQPAWWDVVEGVLNPEPGILRVFYDANQTVYARKDDLETRLRAQSFPLGVNLRNTRSIARVTEQFYKGPRVETPGPVGEPPVTVALRQADVPPRVVAIIKNLTAEEWVRPEDIAVLVSTRAAGIHIATAFAEVGRVCCSADERTPGALTVDTVRRFKGLEATVVILVADRQIALSTESSYVGVSRARARLFVLGDIVGAPIERAILEASRDTDTAEA